MKIYKNLWAGYDAYFIKTGQNAKYAYGYLVHNANKKWDVRSSQFYIKDIREDVDHFPVVGEINLKKLVIDNVLKIVGGNDNVSK